MKTLLYLIMFLNTACATTANYERVLASWVGDTESNLVSRWGIPSASYQMPDSKLLMYQNDGGSYTYGQPIGNMYMMNTTHYACKTTFTINSVGIITDWRWEGNSCKSK